MRAVLLHWWRCVMRSKVEAVATLVRRHLDGIVAWAQTRQTNAFIEVLDSVFRAAKRRARDFARMATFTQASQM